jgi:hypothetical protein
MTGQSGRDSQTGQTEDQYKTTTNCRLTVRSTGGHRHRLYPTSHIDTAYPGTGKKYVELKLFSDVLTSNQSSFRYPKLTVFLPIVLHKIRMYTFQQFTPGKYEHMPLCFLANALPLSYDD